MGGSRPGRGDLIAIGFLTVVCLVLRIPGLDRIGLNPDESQYEATAAYLVDTGVSAFDLPHTSGGTFAVFATLARLFGSYPTEETRILVLLLCLTAALLVYGLVRRTSGILPGLVAGLAFCYLQAWFEGNSANREWFTLPFLLGAAWCALAAVERRGRRRYVGLLVAGGLAGLSLWFKMQSAPVTLAIPTFCVVRALTVRRWREAVADVAAYAAGGVAVMLVYAALFAWHGTLGAYLGSVLADTSGYIGEGAGSRGTDGYRLLVEFYLGRPWPALTALALAAGGLALGSHIVGACRGRENGTGDLRGLAGWLLAWSLVAVSLGGRFFGHYFLYLVPVYAILLATLVPRRLRPTGPGLTAAVVVPMLAFAIDRGRAIAATDPRYLFPVTRHGDLWLYVVLLAAIAALALSRPRRHLATALGAVVLLQVGVAAVQTHRRPVEPSLPTHAGGFERLERAVDSLPAEGPIYVWGWLPEIYSVLERPPSSHLTVAQYLVGDVRAEPFTPTIDPRREAELREDLERRPPRLVIDASSRSWTVQSSRDPWLYDLDRYPDFFLNRLLARDYVVVGRYDGCVLYRRRTAEPAAEAGGPS